MYKAVVVDKDYGSMTYESLLRIKERYENNNIKLFLGHYRTEEEIINNCSDADIILCTGNPLITRKVIENLPKLKVVLRFGIGVNSVDLKAATEHKKVILFMPGFCVDELAEHAASFILSLNRNTAYYDRKIRKGEWPKAKYFQPRLLCNLTLGLFGMGASARSLYKIFKNGFGTKIIAYDPFIDENAKTKYDIEFVDFEQLIVQSDIISLHAPLTKETKYVFNKQVFKKMKKDSMLINVSRGELVNESDLIQALDEGEIGFAGLDVFEKEPIKSDNPLLGMDNVLMTCHSAFYGDKAKENQEMLAKELIIRAFSSGIIQSRYIANRDVIVDIDNFNIVN